MSVRVAYVDLNVKYLNRSREEFVRALSLACRLHCVGPGFSAGDSVAELVSLLDDRRDPVKLVVTTPHIARAGVFSDWSNRRIDRMYRRSYAYAFDRRRFSEMGALNRVLASARVRRLLVLLEADYYNFSQDDIRRFREVADFILGFGPETWSRTEAMPNLGRESFAASANNIWADFLEGEGARVSSMYHLVGDDEFCYVPLAARPARWSVLGVPYHARREAIARLRAAGLYPLVSGSTRRMLAGLKKVGALGGNWSWSIELCQRRFRKALQKSRYSYTCGSGLEMPIRKFFEIPAAGAVLVCRPFRGASDLGFRDGENFIACDPQDILAVHRFLEANPRRAQAIADAGRELVKEKHSVTARAAQIRLALDAILFGTGVGRWRGGHYEIELAATQVFDSASTARGVRSVA